MVAANFSVYVAAGPLAIIQRAKIWDRGSASVCQVAPLFTRAYIAFVQRRISTKNLFPLIVVVGAVIAMGCDPAPSGPSAQPTIVESSLSVPRPAQTLLLRLSGPGLGSRVKGTEVIRDTVVTVDQDDGPLLASPFLIRGYDSKSKLVYETSRREPIQIREFIDAVDVGLDIFDLVPALGDFAVHVPSDLDIQTVRFARRETDSTETSLGELKLDDLTAVAPLASTIVPLRVVADPSAALDIAIIGDGYQQAELADFATHANAVLEAFVATAPYANFASRLNLYRIDVPSAESGASFDCSSTATIEGCRDDIRDTAFGSIFPLRFAEITGRKGLWDVPVFQLKQWELYRAAAGVPYDAIVVLVNTKKFGGFGLYHASLTALDPDTPQGGLHEFGHAFALLADEYTNAASPCQSYALTPDFANMASSATEAANVKWSQWLTPGVPLPTPDDFADKDAVGLFRGVGGGCADLYRPRRHCMMRKWGEAVCPVCAEQMVRRILEVSDPLSNEQIRIENDRLVFDRSGPFEVKLEVQIDGAFVDVPDEGILLTPPESSPYERTFDVRITPSSDLIRSDTSSLTDSGVIRVAW